MVPKEVSILGEGAWGTAIATVLAHNGINVRLWCYDATVARTIKEKRMNEHYLPGIELNEYIQPIISISQAVEGVRWVFEAIPVQYLRSVLEQAKSSVMQEQVWVVLSKGIEQRSLLLPTQIIDDVFNVNVSKAVVAGPSFATEVARKQITAVAVATPECSLAHELQEILTNDYFRLYDTMDVIGVQIAAALKNVITLGVGMLEGAGYGDNTKAFFMTRGLQEIAQITELLGGKQETIYGLAGVGDLVLTSLGKSSRNLEVGRRLGQQESLPTILQKTGYVPEGINTVMSLQQLMQNKRNTFPICSGIYAVVQGTQTVQQLLEQLLHES